MALHNNQFSLLHIKSEIAPMAMGSQGIFVMKPFDTNLKLLVLFPCCWKENIWCIVGYCLQFSIWSKK